MAEKKTTIRGLIGGAAYDLMPKTNVYNVWINDSTTLAAKLAEVVASLNGKVTPEQLEEAIREALDQAIGSVPTPDWNAAEGEEGHIANRTHWTEQTDVEVLPQTELTFDSEMGLATIDGSLTAGTTYRVIWNGTEYVRTAYAVDGVTALGDEGDPFILEDISTEVDVYARDGSAAVTLAIQEVATTVFHPLDTRYLDPEAVLEALPGLTLNATLEDGSAAVYRISGKAVG